MESQVNQVTPIQVEVTVRFPWDHIERELNSRYTRLAQTTRIKGFRPGKVPRQVICRLFEKQVHGEVVAKLIEEGLMGAVQEHALPIVAQPEVDAPAIQKGEALEFVAKCEVRPEITEVQANGLKLYRDETEITDEGVDGEVAKLQLEHSELQQPDPMRAAREGDELVIDFEVSMDGEVKPEMGAQSRSVELGKGLILDSLEGALVGLQPGDEKTVQHCFDDEHPREELQGKAASIKVSVKELRERVLPELDDEFAKDCGDYETLLELRLKVRERLEEAAKQNALSSLRDQAVERLIDANEVPVPPSLIKQQQQQMMMELSAFFQMQGQSADGLPPR